MEDDDGECFVGEGECAVAAAAAAVMDSSRAAVETLRSDALRWAEWSPLYALAAGALTAAAFREAAAPATQRAASAYERAVNAALTKQEEKEEEEEEEQGKNTAGTAARVIDDAWVLAKCREKLPRSLVSDDVASAVLATLKSERSDEELQSELLDVVGWDEGLFDFVGELLAARAELKRNARAPKKELHGRRLASHLEAQQRRRERQAARRQAARDVQNNFGLPVGGALAALCDGLPPGTKRTDTAKWCEVLVPPATAPDSAGSAAARRDALVPISAFDGWAQPVFAGYRTLNRIQSRLFEAAYRGTGNLLICAPTGAGKTNIALMAILHELAKHVTVLPAGAGAAERAVLPRGSAAEFKIVYVAPMKALAQEITQGFAQRLAPLGAVVRELTGDMQLTKKQIGETHVLVTTPEKWDVVTRKSNDSSLAATVRLLIIDEVHLLHEDRGSVLETLVARTFRLAEKTQVLTRVVGLSATLPNYMDVGLFLRADPTTGIFRFDESYRPVPLTMAFVGVKQRNPNALRADMNAVCYDRCVASLRQGYQVMVFVHSRRETVTCAQQLLAIARARNELGLFRFPEEEEQQQQQKGKAGRGVKAPPPPVVVGSKGYFDQQVAKSRNQELRELYRDGFAVHHAGMLRPDRTLVERLFTAGAARVLVCTATLAWGVNLPTHTVIIRGTDVYSAEKGGFVDLGMLDVMQIFGRAGRPQFDTSGEGVIITAFDHLAHYLSLLTHQLPIESRFIGRLADHLNAEVVLGTVTSVREAVQWLASTYLYIRMCKNPLVYGVGWDELARDPTLEVHRHELVCAAARELDDARLIRYDEASGSLAAVNTGRVASHFYIQHESMRAFGEQMRPTMTTAELLQLVCRSGEFASLKFREDEAPELTKLFEDDIGRGHSSGYSGSGRSSSSNSYKKVRVLHFPVTGALDDVGVRVNLLFQAFLSRVRLETFTLAMDSAYIAQNITRLFRGLFEMARHKGWSTVARRLLELSQMADQQQWDTQHALRQLAHMPPGIAARLEARGVDVDALRDMDAGEIGALVDSAAAGRDVARLVALFPTLELSATLQPVTRSVLRVHLTVEAPFAWSVAVHGTAEPWWIWVEDTDNEHIYHQEYFVLTREQHARQDREPITLVFTVPVFEPLPAQYYVRAVSDRWLGAETMVPLSFKRLVLPDEYPPHTDLQDLVPLPKRALHNARAEALFRFTHFNPVQTQVFYTCYHTDHNVLLGAPTGSGKTVAAELAVLKLFRDAPRKKVVYVAPLKALVRERMADWGARFGKMYGKRVVELTGDYTPNVAALEAADIVATTPEKWDGITRNWKSRGYVRLVGLVIIDEIHMLGAERGPVLEVIVSRMRYISEQTREPVRLMGLSTAVANAQDLVQWLGVPPQGVFNFRPAVRPVPLEVHIEGFAGKHYCPRMAAMNKPAYTAICTLSATQPVIVFVSSRRQTRLTAIDLIAFAASDDGGGASYGPKWLHMSSEQMVAASARAADSTLRQMLQFGVGIHHAGLCDSDRALVEGLFRENRIQVLVSTSTLAWGVNLPAHLVVVKGPEFFNPKLCKWVDMPVTDILQMMGRAGRPQYDSSGKAVILVEESKKAFYYKFLYEPFPVESSLAAVMHDHLNAEVCGGTVRSKQDALDYLTWTYYYRRLLKNPSYYGLASTAPRDVAAFLSRLVDDTLADLETCHCVRVTPDRAGAGTGAGATIEPRPLGRIAAYYYLHFTTVALFRDELGPDADAARILAVLCDAAEYDELPVRHSEDELNARLAERLADPLADRDMADPHTKAHLLFQAHMQRVPLPITDYVTDSRNALDQALRVCQAMLDVVAAHGWLRAARSVVRLVQAVCQAVWLTDSPLLALPGVTRANAAAVAAALALTGDSLLPLLARAPDDIVARLTRAGAMSAARARDLARALARLPQLRVTTTTATVASVKGANGATDGGEEEEGASREVHVGVTLQHTGGPRPSPTLLADTPRFHKSKQAGWVVALGRPATQTLLALRRVAMAAPTARTRLVFPAAAVQPGEALVLYVLSDTYVGIDHEVPFHVPSKM